MALDWLLVRVKASAEYVQYSQKFEDVKGYLLDLQGYLLFLLAEQGPGSGEIVEIGSFAGKSTCWLAAGSKRAFREKVTAIDHFTGSPEHQAGAACEEELLLEEGTTYNEFLRNIQAHGFEDYVESIVASSEEAVKGWSKPIRLLFIDGDHSYEESRKDYELWSPFVVAGGVIVFHDIDLFEGVTRFYRELLASDAGYKQAFSFQGLCAISRPIPGSAVAQMET